MEYITLNNQVKMPILGLGTFILEPDDAQAAVECALANGYELIDTANAYVNEKAVGRGNTVILDEPVIAELAAKYGKTPAQVIMRWQVQEGNVVIPGSKTSAHIAENIDVFDFELTDAEMAQVSALDKGKPFYVRTDEALAGFAAWHPDVEGRK